jgi:ribosomal protein L15
MINKLITLNSIPSIKKKSPHRVGRGYGSKGRKSGRGSGGQKAKESVKTEGGQFPTYLRFKKIGFISKCKKDNVLNLRSLLHIIKDYPDKTHFDITDLRKYYNFNHRNIKIINYNLTDEQKSIIKRITIEANKVSSSIKKDGLVTKIHVMEKRKDDPVKKVKKTHETQNKKDDSVTKHETQNKKDDSVTKIHETQDSKKGN